jgi:hypothetical protein
LKVYEGLLSRKREEGGLALEDIGSSRGESECKLVWDAVDSSRFLEGGECRCCRDSRERPNAARDADDAPAERQAVAIAQGVEFAHSMDLLVAILPVLYSSINGCCVILQIRKVEILKHSP